MSKKPDKQTKGRRIRKEEERTGSSFGRRFVVFSTIAAIFFGVAFYQLFTTGISAGSLLNAGITNEEKKLVALDFSVDTVNGEYVYSENKGKTLVYFFSFPG